MLLYNFILNKFIQKIFNFFIHPICIIVMNNDLQIVLKYFYIHYLQKCYSIL